jgi:hypothetical protein
MGDLHRQQLECPACGCRLWQVYLAHGVHQLECRGCGGDVGMGMRASPALPQTEGEKLSN